MKLNVKETHTRVVTTVFDNAQLTRILGEIVAEEAGMPSPDLYRQVVKPTRVSVEVKFEAQKDGLGYERGIRAIVTLTQDLAPEEIKDEEEYVAAAKPDMGPR